MGASGRLQIRGRRLRFGLATSAVTIAAGATAVKVWPHAWPWLIAVAVVLAAGMPVTAPVLAAAQQRRADAAKATQQLQGTTGLTLPRINDSTDLDSRVHRAVLPIPYVHRDVEEEARRHLEAERPVLLVGPSMVGKTQMAITLIKEMFSGRGIAIPDSMDALAGLDTAGVTLRESVIFLDDIDRLVGPGGITDGSIRRLSAAGNSIIATIRAAEYDRHQPTKQLRPPEWDVLAAFERVFVGRTLSETENGRLMDVVSDPIARERIVRTGLGEYVGAAEHIEEALRLGPSVSPTGYALVLAAADWRRAGMIRALPASLLPVLAAPHMPVRDNADLTDKKAYAAALAWATREINPTAALLQRAKSDHFVIYDYALDIVSREAIPIPEPTWPVLIENATPADLVSIGYTAEFSHRRIDVAIQALRKAAHSGRPGVVELAAIGLGVLLQDQGDTEGARKAYWQAVNPRHAVAPIAALNLGVLLHDEGDVEGARKVFQLAVDSQHYDFAPKAAHNLGNMLERQGDVKGAQEAYQRAADSQHTEVAPWAALDLGDLLERQGDVEGATKAFQRAADSQHAEVAPMAEFGLGVILQKKGDVEGAREAYQRAADSQHADLAPMAAFNLGALLEQQLGDVKGARQAYQQAVGSQHTETAARALRRLEELNEPRNDQ